MSNYIKPPNMVTAPYHAVSGGGPHSGSSGPSSGSSGGSSGSSGSSGGYKGWNNDKQSRYEYNCMKRSGDWGALNTPPWMLWVDEVLYAEDALECPEPFIADLWP